MTATQDRPNSPGPDAAITKPGGESSHATARGKVPRTRMGEVWVALVVASLVLLLLLIFILQNGQRAKVSFFGAHGYLPMGVALLLAAVFGVLLVALPGSARIIQLRMLGRRRGTRVPAPNPPTATQHAPDEPPSERHPTDR
jgi:uncharacterized integral membrane protein